MNLYAKSIRQMEKEDNLVTVWVNTSSHSYKQLQTHN